MDKKEFYKIFRNIPKAEIHLHTEGVVSRENARRMLSRKQPEFKDVKKINDLFEYNNLKDFINAFLLIQNSFEYLSDFKALFEDIAKYLRNNGIVYAEMFFAPSLFIKNGWNFKDIVDVFIKKIKKIRKKYNIKIKLLIDVSRTFGQENAMKNLKNVLENRNKIIIGIGLGGDEKKGPAKEFVDVFKLAKKEGLHRVAHAGEDDGPHSIWDALNLLDVERVGHGIASIEDKKLMKYLADNGIPLEICPTSNIFTQKFVKKIEDHPVKDFYNRGIITTLNTDDPTFFNVNMVDEYWNLHDKLGFSLEDLKEIIIYGFESSFLTKKEKAKYIKKVKNYWKKFVR